VIENKLGAGGTLAANAVAKAAPDGYTVLIHHNGMATAPSLYRKLPFFVQRMTELGAEIVPDAKLTSEGLRSWLQAETDRYGPMIRKAGAYAD
jgi:hypothetical protein